MRFFYILLTALSFVLVKPTVYFDSVQAKEKLPSLTKKLQTNPDFSTFTAALETAGLLGVLDKPGPYTVLAPPNDAFAALPEGMLQKLLDPENPEMLDKTMKLHVLKGKFDSAQFDDKQEIEKQTLSGKTVLVKKETTGITVLKANLVKTDLEAANGVIHIVDKAIVPE